MTLLSEYIKECVRTVHEIPSWEVIDSPEDIPCDTEVLLWDGCDYSIDYVEYCPDTGVHYFANGTEATHYMKLTSPEG